jgi:hypothetical protein
MSWEKYTQKDDLIQVSDYVGTFNVIYLGEAIKGSSIFDTVWRIKKYTYDSNNNELQALFSPNYSRFGDIWNNRTLLTYS